MTKYIIGIIIIVVIATLGYTVFKGGSLTAKKTSATIGNEKISLELADTEKKREIGLSTKRSLSANEGMLFVFPTADYPTFWMKGMSFPIDIIFLNQEKVVTIYRNVPAPKAKTETPTTTYAPTQPSNRVIELKAGRADELKIKIGDSIKLSI